MNSSRDGTHPGSHVNAALGNNFTRTLSKTKFSEPLSEGKLLILDKTQVKLFSSLLRATRARGSFLESPENFSGAFPVK